MGSPPRPHDSEGRFAAFFHQSPDSVVLLDTHDPDLPLRIVDCNEAAARLRGLKREEMLGRSINEFSLHPHAPALVLSRIQSLREGGIIRGEDEQIAAGVHAATDLCRQFLMYAGRGHHVKERVNRVETALPLAA